jgi:phosphate transport system substrate-binding protein
MRKILWVLLWLVTAQAASAQNIKGEGSSFALNLYNGWSDQFLRKQGRALDYQPSGSSAGVKAVIDQTVDFGASDRPLLRDELRKYGFAQFPTAIGGVVIVTNLDNVSADKLVLDGTTLADIFLGKIKKWNDPRIVALNSKVVLPDVAIVPVFRTDGSGTSYVFTSFLSKASAAWKQNVGATSQLNIQGGRGFKGNKSVAENVRAIQGAIGYVEYSYAIDLAVPTVRMKNRWGEVVVASAESIQHAMRAADWELLVIDQEPTFELDLVDAGCPRCWPIASPTYVLVPVRGKNAGNSTKVLDFFQQALTDGDQLAASEGYVPLPSRAKSMIKVSMRRWYLALGRGNESKSAR